MKNINSPVYDQAYIDVGSGPPVLLLHGLFGDLAMWRSTVEALKLHYRVIIPRLPILDLPIQHVDTQNLTTALYEFISWHKLKNVTLVGHALGGQLALLYAAQYPSNIQQLVIISSDGILQQNAVFAGEPGVDYTADVPPQVKSVREKTTQAILAKSVHVSDRNPTEATEAETISLSSGYSNVASLLNKLDHPTLLLWGADDKTTPPEVALHFHDFLLNSEVKFIDRCGHLPMLEQPDIFNHHLLTFINKWR